MKSIDIKHLIPKNYRRARIGERLPDDFIVIINGIKFTNKYSYYQSWRLSRVSSMNVPIFVKKI